MWGDNPADDIRSFLTWMEEHERQVFLCSPGYAGEMIEIGDGVEKLITEYIAHLKASGGV